MKQPITSCELIILINSLKNIVTGREDQITTEVIKQNHKRLINPLLHIINCILGSEVFQSIQEKAVIIFNDGNIELTLNYIPIELIDTVSKLVEKCVKAIL